MYVNRCVWKYVYLHLAIYLFTLTIGMKINLKKNQTSVWDSNQPGVSGHFVES